MARFEDVDHVRCFRAGMAAITLISAWIFVAPTCVANHPHARINVWMLRVRFEMGLLILVGLLCILVVIHSNDERIVRSAARGI
ncbi:MAG: hypothetical protein A2286_05435 [Gammaproteobacteria bacterium RIFOXYA12_FULL_61_12]|nr:MAG: hypothetical protein A2514_04855 [Gammaproteobacteria bacterium RIFOXYD12_FULL_61_37]OGT92651.1 MAG: hypothetical protein A2286_05435 [Gammaproteobacteria bacterium RIFOXYA12_FULL_61_12]